MNSAFHRMERQLVAAVTADRPNVPEAGRLLWMWFLDLSAARPLGYAMPGAISFGEIESYARLNRIEIQPHHVRIILTMDRALMAKRRSDDLTSAPDGVEKLPRTSNQQLTPENFDAVFAR